MGFALQFLDLYRLTPNSSHADIAAALASRGPMLLPNCYQPLVHPFCRREGNDAALDLTTLARIEARRVSDDPARTLTPAALAGAVLLTLADLLARVIPSGEELRLGVVTALFGAPLFAFIAWRAARSWRT